MSIHRVVIRPLLTCLTIVSLACCIVAEGTVSVKALGVVVFTPMLDVWSVKGESKPIPSGKDATGKEEGKDNLLPTTEVSNDVSNSSHSKSRFDVFFSRRRLIA